MTRREFLRYYGVASSGLTLSPLFLDRMSAVCQAAEPLTRVYVVKNGDCFQNIAKLWQMLDGPAKYINATDVVVIKGNAQWPNQGYTHTGCIKAVIDQILQIPGFSGEILLCDNLQGGGNGAGTYAFDVPPSNRINNWPDRNWTELATDYRAQGMPVAAVQWQNDTTWREPTLPLPSFSCWDPANGPGWTRYFLNLYGRNTYISYPIFQSPLTPGRLIDMKNGVWESGAYTGRKVKAIFMPTLNNHGVGAEDYAGATSAVKSFFGATEIFHGSPSYVSDDFVWSNYDSIHSSSFTHNNAQAAGQLVGNFIRNLYSPVLYITAAMYSGWYSRTASDGAVATNTVLACTDPVTLDYVACRDLLSKVGNPHQAYLDPSAQNNNTWLQLFGCNSEGIGTLLPKQIEIITYDFLRPTATRLDVDRKIRDFKAGLATEQEVKDVINLYQSGG